MRTDRKAEMIKLLKENDRYVSGQDLGGMLGISRSAVWKGVRQLQEEGYQIEAVPNRGYHMSSAPDIITAEEIKSLLTTKAMAREIRCFAEVDSTNNKAKQLAEKQAAHGLLVTAEVQSAGRGRRGRNWSSPSGTGVWMTLLLRPAICPKNASMLTLTAALAVTGAIRETAGLESYIKWPNDIVVNGKKVCGILTEMSSEAGYIHYIVIGMGINVNMEELPEPLGDAATSLFLEGGRKLSRSRLIASVMENFEKYYQLFLQKQNVEPFLLEYNEQLVNCNKKVKIIEPGTEYIGEALGIDAEGRLLVKLPDGEQKAIASGEVSVRGLYGYTE